MATAPSVLMRWAVTWSLLGGLVATGCGAGIPRDVDGTLDRVREDGVLRVGASPSPGWVAFGAEGDPVGREPELVEGFARHLGVDVVWTVGGEEHLVGLLEDGDLDMAVGGTTDQNPWVEKVALTRPYVELQVDGSTEAHVMIVPMGENALQSELERWLDENGDPS